MDIVPVTNVKITREVSNTRLVGYLAPGTWFECDTGDGGLDDFIVLRRTASPGDFVVLRRDARPDEGYIWCLRVSNSTLHGLSRGQLCRPYKHVDITIRD